jgi:uncharacterized Zn-binding protein involved in type VI secretion
MPPAATVGDQTSHGTPLSSGPGSSNVFIGGKPAWRCIIDVHSCPLSDGPKPHVGGSILKGSTTVLINNAPAARVGDSITEASAPNFVTSGVNNVIIG